MSAVDSAIRGWADANLTTGKVTSLTWSLLLADAATRRAAFSLGVGQAVLNISWEDTFTDAGDDTCLALTVDRVEDSSVRNWIEALQEHASEGASIESVLSKGLRMWQNVAAKFESKAENLKSDEESTDEASDQKSDEEAKAYDSDAETVGFENTRAAVPIQAMSGRVEGRSLPQHSGSKRQHSSSGPESPCLDVSGQKVQRTSGNSDCLTNRDMKGAPQPSECRNLSDDPGLNKEGNAEIDATEGGGEVSGKGRRDAKGRSREALTDRNVMALATTHLSRYFRDVKKICHEVCYNDWHMKCLLLNYSVHMMIAV